MKITKDILTKLIREQIEMQQGPKVRVTSREEQYLDSNAFERKTGNAWVWSDKGTAITVVRKGDQWLIQYNIISLGEQVKIVTIEDSNLLNGIETANRHFKAFANGMKSLDEQVKILDYSIYTI